MKPEQASAFAYAKRYERYLGLLAVAVVLVFAVRAVFTTPHGAAGVAKGQMLPPFVVPLATGPVNGDANVATRANEGSAGRRPACTVRGPELLNICELYERGPVVLTLFVNAGSCPRVLQDLQRLVPAFPEVRFAGVEIKGDRGALRGLVRARGLTFPIGYDHDGVLAGLYKVGSCPQVTFAYPGGVVESRALLTRPGPGVLQRRVSELLAAARARGWRPAKA